jgi:hypothetical protein
MIAVLDFDRFDSFQRTRARPLLSEPMILPMQLDVKTDVRACGLLVDDPAAQGTFRFGHKSFMEFSYASIVAERLNSKAIAYRISRSFKSSCCIEVPKCRRLLNTGRYLECKISVLILHSMLSHAVASRARVKKAVEKCLGTSASVVADVPVGNRESSP